LTKEYRILVCGGRNYDNAQSLVDALEDIVNSIPDSYRVVLIHGAARGADSIAEGWAEWRGLKIMAFRADWKRYGRAAGAIRNTEMLESGRPDLVVAAPGGTGTANMITQAYKYGVQTIVLKE